jgi:tetratricopeptide (TPR) repeat protein
MSESWTVYTPVGLPGTGRELEFPSAGQIEKEYLKELTTFIDREIYQQVASMQAEITKSGETAGSLNKLGVLYARYGLYDRAEREFSKALQKDPAYLQATVNLGNIAFLQGDFKKAFTLFDAAWRKEPDSPGALLGLARASHKLENFGIVQEAYGRLKELSPEVARKYSYLEMRGEEAARAASSSADMESVRWEE